MRVVLDTNVLVSGTFWTGASYHVLKFIDSKKLVLIVSKEIIAEYDRVLHDDEIMNKAAYSIARAESVKKIVQMATFVYPEEKINIVKEDPDDDKFIEAAVAGNATVIISKDNHLLKLKNFRLISIISPEEFLRSHNE